MRSLSGRAWNPQGPPCPTVQGLRVLTGRSGLHSFACVHASSSTEPRAEARIIDSLGQGSVDFRGFVARAPGVWLPGVLVVVLAGLAGCTPRQPSPGTEDSHTAGRITIVCVPDAIGLIERELEAFQALYPDAEIHVRTGTSRDAVSALYAAEADLAVVARELEPEERDAASAAGLDLQGYRYARDALVVVVHPENPVENVSREDVAGIYRGDVTRWSELGGGAGSIVPVVQPPDTDLSLFLMDTLLDGEPPGIRAVTAPGDSAVVAAVRSDPRAVGYVSLAAADRGARALRVAATTGLSYWKPDLEAVYKGDYPLTRFQNVFVRADGAKLAHGFITFVTSEAGQRIVHEAGLVPTTVPVRFVRRSPMIGAHDQ